MEKNKLYIFIIFLLLVIISCSNNNIQKGRLYSKVYTDVSFEASKMKAIDDIYYNIAKETAVLINRNDFNKEYIASGIFGESRDTDDIEGNIIKKSDNNNKLSFEELKSIIKTNF